MLLTTHPCHPTSVQHKLPSALVTQKHSLLEIRKPKETPKRKPTHEVQLPPAHKRKIPTSSLLLLTLYYVHASCTIPGYRIFKQSYYCKYHHHRYDFLLLLEVTPSVTHDSSCLFYIVGINSCLACSECSAISTRDDDAPPPGIKSSLS